MFKRILVPLDGSSLAESVLPLARFIAEQYGATLILFHVVEKAAPGAIHGEHHLQDVREAKAYLEDAARQVSSVGVTILQNVHEVQTAGVAQMISDHVGELQADLVVLCAHGHGGLRDAVSGSIAQQVIRQVTVPVAFVRPNHGNVFGKDGVHQLLLPLDGSQAHEVAIPVAVSLAQTCAATVRLLTVVPTNDTLSVKEAITGRVSPRATALTLDIRAQQAEEYLRQVSRNFSAQSVPATTQVSRGDPLTKLMESLSAEQVDLVIMATHGHSSIDAHWEGSLTPRFLPKTPVPVILVRGTGNDNT
jgi:nucleotide-binding universal stress UspA family protein